jgi:hypothetical protein
MIKLRYSSNNSGGYWWLDDDDWKNLEAAGWNVKWVKDDEYYGPDERWLGCLAKEASKEFNTADEGIEEWSDITGENPNSEGCNCCGPPHSFSYEDENGEHHYSSVVVTNTERTWY